MSKFVFTFFFGSITILSTVSSRSQPLIAIHGHDNYHGHEKQRLHISDDVGLNQHNTNDEHLLYRIHRNTQLNENKNETLEDKQVISNEKSEPENLTMVNLNNSNQSKEILSEENIDCLTMGELLNTTDYKNDPQKSKYPTYFSNSSIEVKIHSKDLISVITNNSETQYVRKKDPKSDTKNTDRCLKCKIPWFNNDTMKGIEDFAESVALLTCKKINIALSLNIDCSKVSDRIVGGDHATAEEYPFIAHYNGNCGSSILSRKWLITAAHCLEKGDYVMVGSKYVGRGVKYAIKKHITHPLYDPMGNDAAYDYDFQLLELRSPLRYSSTVQPIQLGNHSDVIPGSVATVLGWGITSEDSRVGSPNLMAAAVPIMKNRSCKESANGYFKAYITDRMICAGYKAGGRDACQGDSGGPLIHNRRLIGVVSFGIGCARPGFPGVYARVPSVRKWIIDHVVND